ncbi:hypothetical protein J1605_008295 [Eschrichtius robustus]|uniref:Uncharacterized protein n=1 Tax=Eschrichtius robustus TaxID=9764 RepID=A0AB34GVJ0_ESCRO|nr:hypothetical protein J1605_008295 [Eschrichtius robustus]
MDERLATKNGSPCGGNGKVGGSDLEERKKGSDAVRIGDPVRQPRKREIIQTAVKTHLTTCVNLSTRLGQDMRCEESSFDLSEKDAISILVCVYFPLTLWVKISLTITLSEYVPAHPMLHHQVERQTKFHQDVDGCHHNGHSSFLKKK